jgi:putative Holliday junction resolvase
MRQGVRLGIDVGTVRIGVARSDRDGLLATPLETIDRSTDYVQIIYGMISELSPVEILVGLPLSLSGQFTQSTRDALDVARQISRATEVPVRMLDERLTTVSAHSVMKAAGKNQKQSRSVIDQVAAVMILQNGLDAERSSGNLPGAPLSEFPELS